MGECQEDVVLRGAEHARVAALDGGSVNLQFRVKTFNGDPPPVAGGPFGGSPQKGLSTMGVFERVKGEGAVACAFLVGSAVRFWAVVWCPHRAARVGAANRTSSAFLGRSTHSLPFRDRI